MHPDMANNVERLTQFCLVKVSEKNNMKQSYGLVLRNIDTMLTWETLENVSLGCDLCFDQK